MVLDKKKNILDPDLLRFFSEKLSCWIILNSTIGRRLEKETGYKFLDADDFHSQSNKGVYMMCMHNCTNSMHLWLII